MDHAPLRNGRESSNSQTVIDELTVAEYFAGIGLFRMGLERAGWKVTYANDWDPKRASIYKGFFGDAYEVKDLFAVDVRDVPRTTLATCSFPCIDLSLAGNFRGLNGKHSSAFWGFYDILRTQGSNGPPIVLLENVPGWLSANNGMDFYAVAQALNQLGYACDAFTLNARCFVPHSRPRVFMLGVNEIHLSNRRKQLTGFSSPRSGRICPTRLRTLMWSNQRIRWAHLDIPEPPPYRNLGFSEEIVEQLPPEDPRWWPREKVEKHLGMMSPSHLAMVKALSRGERETARTFYRRRRAAGQRAEVRSDDIAGCLRTAAGGSGVQFLLAAGMGTVGMRALTPREYARLQGVPDSFAINANTTRQSLNAFGDAVCVPVVFWIAQNVLMPLVEELNLNQMASLE